MVLKIISMVVKATPLSNVSMKVERLRRGAAFKLNADVHVVNVGLEQDTSDLEYIDQQVIRKGSHFFGVEPVISQDELERALELGFTYADALHADGLQVVAIGNVGGERAFLDSLVTTATITAAPMTIFSFIPNVDLR